VTPTQQQEPSAAGVAGDAAQGAQETPGERLRRLVDGLGAAIVEAAWLLALITVPIYFNIYSSRSFEPDKVALVTVLAGVIAAAWLAKAVAGGALWPPRGRAGGSYRSGVALLAAGVAFLAAATLATALSVSPLRSWNGSFFRQQGLATLLAYLVLALAIAAHLRSIDQWRRLALAITLGSLPVCAYAVVQRLGLDTIGPTDDELRVSSTLGNPIFLGGYLLMALLVTVCAATRRLPGGRHAVRRLGLASVALLQLATLVLSQSRGPLLGLGAGVFVLLLAGAVSVRGGRSLPVRGRHRGWMLVVAAGAATLALLILVAVPGSPLAGLRRLPLAGRLAGALDPTAPTARVRLLIWRGVVVLTTGAPPLRGAGGEADPLHRARLLIGHGLDCFDLAFNQVYPHELGTVEPRDSIPDRAHSETFDVLIGAGVAGLVAWLALLAWGLAVGTSWAVCGESGGGAAVRTLAAALAGAGVAGAVTVAIGRADLAGPLVPAGLLAGVCTGMVRAGLRAGAPSPAAPVRELTLAVSAAVAGHFTEVSVGIPVTASRLLFWCLLGALIAAGLRRLEPGENEGAAGSGAEGERAREAVLAALLAGVALGASAYTLMDRPATDAMRALVAGVPESLGAGLRAAGSAVPVLVIGALAATVTLWAHAAGGRSSRGARLAVLGAALLPVVALAALKSQRLAATAALQRLGAGNARISEHVAGHAGVFCGATVALVLVTAMLLIRGERARSAHRTALAPLAAVAALLLAFVAIVTTLVARRALAPIRADTFAKHAAALIEAERPLEALRLLATASWLAPAEPSLLTLVARATVLASRAPLSPAGRRAAVEAGERALELAARLQPLDPDHAINLGRVLTAAAALAPDAAARRALLERAERAYARGLELRPGSVLFRTERAGALARLGRDEAAAGELAAVLAADPAYDTAALLLAGIEHARAVAAQRAGRGAEARRYLEAALAVLESLRARVGGHGTAAQAVATLYAVLGRRDEAVSALEGLVDGREPAAVHEMLALLHLEAGREADALEEAESAVRVAGAAGRGRAEATLALVRARVGTAAGAGKSEP